MTINEMINFLEENYEEIDVFEHINTWSKEIATGYNTFATCIFVNLDHKTTIQSMVHYPTNETTPLETCPIYEIYIAYEEDKNNQIHRVFRYTDPKKEHMSYMEIVTIEEAMGWLNIPKTIEGQGG